MYYMHHVTTFAHIRPTAATECCLYRERHLKMYLGTYKNIIIILPQYKHIIFSTLEKFVQSISRIFDLELLHIFIFQPYSRIFIID